MKYGRELPGYPYNFKAKLTRAIVFSQRKLFGERGAPFASVSSSAPLPLSYQGQAASDAISALLEGNSPCLVARFGWGEVETALRGLDKRAFLQHPIRQILRFVRGDSGPFWWDNSVRAGIVWMCGYFPADDAALMRFSEQYCEDLRQIDLLASYAAGETRLSQQFFPHAKAFPLGDYEPFWYDRPWSRCLKGKRVLVVSSFPDTIRMQYSKRERLFSNPEMLPPFDLITYRSISSFAGNEVPYATWFDALKKMEDDISKINFDVALIGCGAYGLPLGAYVKRVLNRKALHTAGITQLFFGIRGKRWDDIPRYPNSLYNEEWIRPLESDRVQSVKTIEGGCYW
ncbi:MAG: hypothetical protein PUE68_01635 [Kiritimatiellae bacterium]|nr:hypothetical protein [Kiritimatiellia bacterium]